MSGYVRNLKLEVPFDGDTVKFMLRHLEWNDFKVLAAAKDNKDQDILDLFKEMLPRYVVSFDGLTDAAGSSVELSEVCQVTYFYPLVGRCFKFLMEEAVIKNPKAFGEISTPSSPEAAPNSGSIQAATGLLTG